MKNLKKLIAVGLIFCLALTSVTSIAFADEPSVITVFVDGVQIEFDVDPITESDRTLVPMRAIFEALGAEVTWDDATWTATAVRGGDVMNVTIDSNILYKNGTAVELDVPARMVGDRTLVPVRAISESFDALVEWNEEAQQVIITTAAEATATPAPTATPVPVSTPAATPSATPSASGDSENGIPATELSDSDFELLLENAENIRYNFEQYNMPAYVFENSADIYDMMKDDGEGFIGAIENVWDRTVSGAILSIQIDSEDTYAFDAGFIDELDAADSIQAIYGDIFERAGMRFKDLIEGATIYEDEENGDYITVIEFENADSSVQCKYIGIVASDDKDPRYFTAENEMLDPANWYFCEVGESSHSLIGGFAKDDQALVNFANICLSYYNMD